METKINSLGIDENLNRSRIRKLLLIGLIASIITGVGDFLLGFAEETSGSDLATNMMSSAPNLADWQLLLGGFLGMVGIFLEGLCFFALYRLMADCAPKLAHIYRGGIFGYIWLAPIGCHMNIGILNLAYKYLLQTDADIAASTARTLYYGFSLPIYILLILFWLPMIVVQFIAFYRKLTPYPRWACCFNLILGCLPALIAALIAGPSTAWGAAIGTTFLSLGNAVTFGGLLFTLPSEEQFAAFKRERGI